MLESFILRWGYLAVGVGTFFEGEAILVAAGAFAHRGLLSLPVVIVAAFLGSLAGDQVWFHVGRRFGRPFIERHAHWNVRAERARVWLSRYGSLFVFGFRFVYGIRSATPVFLGAAGYPTRRFVVLNVLGAAVWATAFGLAGWALGLGLQAALRRSARAQELLAAVVAVALATAFAAHRFRRRRGSARQRS